MTLRVTAERCEKCRRWKGEKHKRTTPEPTIDDVHAWLVAGKGKATDGCECPLRGECEHGHDSWAMLMGLV